jgi:hypothetical protein
MKKSILFFLAICLITGNPVYTQKPGLLKKVTNSMTSELLGKPEKANQEPEPACACDQPEVVMDLGGKLQLDYKELTISVLNDGRILAKAHGTDQYYIVKDGVTQGPLDPGDPRVAEFEAIDADNNSVENFILRNKPYIIRSGEKFLIIFGGKSYGPYAQINNFVVTKSKDKFAAMVVENILVTEDEGRKLEEAIKNAKTDQEKMDLSMKYAQEMQQKMLKAGGPAGTLPKLVTNVPNATYDPLKNMAGILNANVKYDDILMIAYDKIIDLQGNTIITIMPELAASDALFVNTSNTKYAYGGYGTLTFSDNTTMSDLFSPHLVICIILQRRIQ